jgi:hypothetical protein
MAVVSITATGFRIGDAMSDRHFLHVAANDYTQEWEAYVVAINRFGIAAEELNRALHALAEARDALAAAVLEDVKVSS